MRQCESDEGRPGLRVTVHRNFHNSKERINRWLHASQASTLQSRQRKEKGYVSRARERSRTQIVGQKWKERQTPQSQSMATGEQKNELMLFTTVRSAY